MEPKTQDDLVKMSKGYQPEEIIRKVRVPDIERLHTKSVEEIASVIANVVRMESVFTKLVWVPGKGIELTIPVR